MQKFGHVQTLAVENSGCKPYPDQGVK